MTRKELIKAVIRGEKPPYTPHHFDLTLYITDLLGKYYGYSRADIEDYIGNHFLYVDFTAPADRDSGYRGHSGSSSTRRRRVRGHLGFRPGVQCWRLGDGR